MLQVAAATALCEQGCLWPCVAKGNCQCPEQRTRASSTVATPFSGKASLVFLMNSGSGHSAWNACALSAGPPALLRPSRPEPLASAKKGSPAGRHCPGDVRRTPQAGRLQQSDIVRHGQLHAQCTGSTIKGWVYANLQLAYLVSRDIHQLVVFRSDL